jgi:hypothetical protein
MVAALLSGVRWRDLSACTLRRIVAELLVGFWLLVLLLVVSCGADDPAATGAGSAPGAPAYVDGGTACR